MNAAAAIGASLGESTFPGNSMHFIRPVLLILLVAAALGWAGVGRAVTISIRDVAVDDEHSFFGAGNPQGATAGAQAKAAVQAAAGVYSNLLNDTLSAIVSPPQWHGSLGTTVTWFWNVHFYRPQDGLIDTKPNIPVADDEYVIYVGARGLASNTLAIGAPGWAEALSSGSGQVTAAEQAELNQIGQSFGTLVTTRGETGGFVSWGGSFAVDNDGSTDWHFNHTTTPTAGKSDFFTVALHEIGHALGFGNSGSSGPTPWSMLVDTGNNTFTGSNAQARYGGPVPLASGGNTGHWKEGLMSAALGTGAMQEVLMDPTINPGTRKTVSELDAAALADIGWEINLPQLVPGDYNRNGIVDAADYIVWRMTRGSTTDLRANGDNSGASANRIDQADYTYWRTQFGNAGAGGAVEWIGTATVPEPASLWLLLVAVISAWIGRSRRVPTQQCFADRG